jgi:hypothetical protein
MTWKPSSGMSRANSGMWGTIGNMGRQSGWLDQEYRKYRGFDPADSFKEYAGGAWKAVQGDLADNLESLASKAAGAGRLNTGFYDRDQGELMQRTMQDYQNTIAQGAMQTAGMKQNQYRDLVNVGQQQQSAYMDALSGQWDREAMMDDKRQQSKGSFWKTLGNIAGVGGKIAGAAIKGF